MTKSGASVEGRNCHREEAILFKLISLSILYFILKQIKAGSYISAAAIPGNFMIRYILEYNTTPPPLNYKCYTAA